MDDPTSLPAPPSPLRRADSRDFGRLVRLTVEAIVILIRRDRTVQVIVGVCVALSVVALVVGALLGGALLPSIAVGVGLFWVISPIAVLVAGLVHASVRLSDRRRIVVLDADRACAVDVRLFDDRTLRLCNHSRLLRSTGAPAFRARIADWMRGLIDDGWSPDIVAQNPRVAAIYAGQFPTLLRPGAEDRQGRVRLEVVERDASPRD